jgi:uncharacterized OB-fold protein
MAPEPVPGSHAAKVAPKAERTPTRFEPPVTELTEPFWEATRERRFLLQWCVDCDTAQFFPRDICLACGGTDLEWREASGTAVVYAVTVENKPMNPAINGGERYTIALVDLAEGPRMMTNVFGCPPDDVHIGMPVQLAWEPLSDGRHLPTFKPATT